MTFARRSSLLLVVFLPLCINLSAQRSSLLRVPQSFRTIQSAVNAARIGDTVLVDHGMYYENVRIWKNIVVGSRFLVDGDLSHRLKTIVDGSRARDKRKGSTLFIQGGTDTTCAVVGLTIQGGTGSVVHVQGEPGFEYWVDGGGIHLEQAGARIAHNYITRNVVSSIDNVTNTGGAGIGTTDSTMGRQLPPLVIIEHNLVTENTASGGWTEVAGISVVQPGVVRNNTVMRNCALARRRAPGGGIGVFLTGPYEILVERNYVRSNIAGFGGGVLAGTSGTRRGRVVIVNNIIAENYAYELGGGVHVAGACALLVNNTIVGNTAGSHRSGVNATASSMTTQINNIVWNADLSYNWLWTSMRLVNNLSNEDPPGSNTLRIDPLFIPGDSLFRLSPHSPAIGLGSNETTIGDLLLVAPAQDYRGVPRRNGGETQIDLGAIHSGVAPGPEALAARALWTATRSTRAKVAWKIRQVSLPVYQPDSQQIVHAGLMSTSITINDSTRYDLDDTSSTLTVTLPPSENVLEVEVVARGLQESTRLYAVIRLEGLDEPGLILEQGRDYAYKKYVNLSPGLYVLSGYAGDETGFIDRQNSRTITISVLPHWYQRWWAYVMLIIAVAGPASFAFSNRIARLRREKFLQQQFTERQMDYQEAERKRLAAELHDGLGQGLLAVNSELRQLLLDDPQPSEDLRRIAGLVQESIDEVREISTSLRPHHLDRFGLCAATETLVEKIRHSAGLTVEWTCDETDPPLSKERRLHVYRIIQESLSNIVKHAGATVVRVEVCTQDGLLSVSISDNGKGMDGHVMASGAAGPLPNDTARGFGLASMAERARIIGGTFSIDSRPHGGTVVRLELPLNGD